MQTTKRIKQRLISSERQLNKIAYIIENNPEKTNEQYRDNPEITYQYMLNTLVNEVHVLKWVLSKN